MPFKIPAPVFWYLVAINAATFLMYGLDKLLSKSRARRISERALIALAICGGSVGALLAMYLFRHKTRHRKFFIGVPIILAIQVVLLFFTHHAILASQIPSPRIGYLQEDGIYGNAL